MSDPRVDMLESRLVALQDEVTLLRDIQDIRTLHFTYGYCMDKWLFKEIIDLFAEDCELHFLNGIWRGKEGARRLYSWTEGVYGPRDGMLAEHVIAQDIVHVAPDRSRAWGRFRALLQIGAHRDFAQHFPPSFAQAFWEAGVHENEYVLEDGVWKIALFNYRLTFQAPYEGGWAESPNHPIMITPWTGTFPEVPNGPDELRPMPPQWPRAVMQPFHYTHPVTGKPIGADVQTDGGVLTMAARLAFMKLIVSDLGEMTAFYKKAFGFAQINGFDTPDFEEAMLRQEDNDFMLLLLRYKDGRRHPDAAAHGPTGFVCTDLQASVDDALAAGAVLKLGPLEVEGTRVAFVGDPEGHEIEIIQFL